MSGLLNKLVSDGAIQILGTVPDAPFSSVTIRAVNSTGVDVPIRLWASVDILPSMVDLIEYAAIVPGNGGTFERSCLIMSAGENLFVQAAPGVTFRVETVDEA